MTARDTYRAQAEQAVLQHLGRDLICARDMARKMGWSVQCVGHVLRRLATKGLVIERVQRDRGVHRWVESRRYYQLSVAQGKSSGAWWDLRPR